MILPMLDRSLPPKNDMQRIPINCAWRWQKLWRNVTEIPTLSNRGDVYGFVKSRTMPRCVSWRRHYCWSFSPSGLQNRFPPHPAKMNVCLCNRAPAQWRAASSLAVVPQVIVYGKLQAPVYDVLPSATAVFSYAVGSRKLSANKQFCLFVGAQTVVSLLQTTQIKQGVSFIAANKVYTSADKTTIVWIETELFFFFLPVVDASRVYVRALALGCFYSHISTRTFLRALTASLDSCADIKSAPSVA